MPSYSDLTTTLNQTARTRETGLPLLSDSCRSRFFLQSQPSQRVCLFFHGFTASPYQFVPMGKAFHKAGYNVLIPLLPGHGQAGTWSKTNPPPLPTDPKVYQQFALDWLKTARSLGKEVIVGGLSGGGTLAGWLALERPQEIYRTMLFAAYLSSSSKLVDLFVRSSSNYLEWTGEPALTDLQTGYKGFAIPSLRTFLNLGQQVLDRARRTTAAPPMFIISSESDIAVGNFDHKALFESVLPRQPITWYHLFSRALSVPHTMMTQAEGNQWEMVLISMAKAFVESRLSWSEVEEIGYRMTQGKTFDRAIAELNLTAKASRDMPAMMTMVDKRAIVEARNPAGS